jgi:hypothetical protein
VCDLGNEFSLGAYNIFIRMCVYNLIMNALMTAQRQV